MRKNRNRVVETFQFVLWKVAEGLDWLNHKTDISIILDRLRYNELLDYGFEEDEVEAIMSEDEDESLPPIGIVTLAGIAALIPLFWIGISAIIILLG